MTCSTLDKVLQLELTDKGSAKETRKIATESTLLIACRKKVVVRQGRRNREGGICLDFSLFLFTYSIFDEQASFINLKTFTTRLPFLIFYKRNKKLSTKMWQKIKISNISSHNSLAILKYLGCFYWKIQQLLNLWPAQTLQLHFILQTNYIRIYDNMHII